MSARERLLDAAAEIMRTRGVAATTTKQIALAAGYSEALLYKHFRDKDELLVYVLKERMPEFPHVLDPGTATVEANLVAVAHSALRFYQRGFPMMASMVAQPSLMAQTRDSLRKYGSGPHYPVQKLVSYLLAEQQLSRIAAAADPEAIAALLMGACFQQGFLAYVAGGLDSPDIPESAAVALVRPLLPALLPAPSPETT